MIRGLPVALTGWSPGRTRGASGGIRENGLGLVPEGLSVGLRGHVSASERSPEGVVLRLVSKKGASGKGFSGGWHRVVRLEING